MNRPDASRVRRVVVGIDGSEHARLATLWAAREALRRDVPLRLVHALDIPGPAVPPIEPADAAERRERAGSELVKAEAAKITALYPAIAVEAATSSLPPVQCLAELTADDALVVTGTRGHVGIAGILLGSVSRSLATHANGPLIVVRGAEAETESGAVVLGVGAQPTESAIEYAFAAARRYGAALRIVHAWIPPTPSADLGLPDASALGLTDLGAVSTADPQDALSIERDEAADTARAVGPIRARYQDIETEITAPAGDAVPVLTEAAATARLVVLGAHRHRGPFAVGAGHVVEGLLSHSPVPVAVVPE